MGFLSNLLTPHKHIGMIKNSVKGFASGNVMQGIDAAGYLSGKYDHPAVSSGPKMDPTDPGTGVTDPAQYMGDEEDDGYGSFSDPFNVEAFYDYQDPGYAFELQQGQQAVQNAASAGSGAFSGAALKDLLKYSQGFARTGYNDAFNRYQTQQGNIFNRLATLLTVGQNAAAGVGSQGTTLAGNAGQAISNAGSAAGAGYVGAGNAIGNGLTNYWLMKQFGQPAPQAVG